MIKCDICGYEKRQNKYGEFNEYPLLSGNSITVCKQCLFVLIKRRHEKDGIIKSGLTFIKGDL